MHSTRAYTNKVYHNIPTLKKAYTLLSFSLSPSFLNLSTHLLLQKHKPMDAYTMQGCEHKKEKRLCACDYCMLGILIPLFPQNLLSPVWLFLNVSHSYPMKFKAADPFRPSYSSSSCPLHTSYLQYGMIPSSIFSLFSSRDWVKVITNFRDPCLVRLSNSIIRVQLTISL